MIQFKHSGIKIALVVWVLFALILAVNVWLVKSALLQHINTQAAIQLDRGEQIFVRLLQQRAQSQGQVAQTLAAELSFREVLLSAQPAGIASALQAFQTRLHASATTYVSADGLTQLGTRHPVSSVPFSLQDIEQLRKRGVLTFIEIDGVPSQLLVVPVKAAPSLIGWILLGFPLDQPLADQVRQLTGLDVSVWRAGAAQDWRSAGSTLPVQAQARLRQAIQTLAAGQVSLEHTTFRQQQLHIRVRTLHTTASIPWLVILQSNASQYATGLRDLLLGLWILAFCGLALCAGVLWLWFRQAVVPAAAMLQGIQALGNGNEQTTIWINRQDEWGLLGRAFNSMRAAIQARSHRLHTLALTDALTGLANRAQLLQCLTQALQHNPGAISVIVLNLRAFKEVNLVFGEPVGDALLQAIASMLKPLARQAQDVVARLHADTFVLLRHETDQAAAMRVIAQVEALFADPVVLAEHRLPVQVRAGLAVWPQHGRRATELLQHALQAVQHANSQKVRWTVYHDALASEQAARMAMAGALATAVAQQQFVYYLQPRIALATRQVVGVEVLIRWAHPGMGLLLPAQFMPVAEQAGMASALTADMLDRVCRMIRLLHQQGIRLPWTVNLSAADWCDARLPEQVAAALQAQGLPMRVLALACRAETLLQHGERVLQGLRRSVAMGMAVTLDAVGAGGLPLAALAQVSWSEFNLDQTLLQQPAARALVKAMIDLAHQLGARATAIGLEQAESMDWLSKAGCDCAQGFWIAAPMPEHDFPVWLERWQHQQLHGHALDVDVGEALR